MHNPESVKENETHQLDFEIQTDHQTTRPNDSQHQKKKKKKKEKERTYRIVNFSVLAGHMVKLNEKKKES